MGVKIKKRGSKWYVYVNYHGKARTGASERARLPKRSVGNSRRVWRSEIVLS
jgi:hypothetical protein